MFAAKHIGRYSFLIALLFSLAIDANSQGYVIKTKTQLSQVSRTYGFLLGQEYSLRRITSDFPDLSSQVTLARNEFALSYGRAQKEIPISLKNALESDYTNYEQKLMTQLDSITKAQVISKDIATKFISEVNNRTKGNLPSPILETLLSYQYYLSPEQEIIDHYTYIFKTLNHAKSKGTDWLIKIPKSWSKSEASRPNIIQEFRSNNGNGLEGMSIMVKELPIGKNYVWSSKDLSDMFTEKALREAVPAGAKYISSKKITLDNNQAGMLEIEQVLPRLDMEFKMRSVQFFVYKGNKIYMLMCFVSSPNKDEDLQSRMNIFLPLFKLVANSIVFNDQYKK